jgi:predicted small secreted protein
MVRRRTLLSVVVPLTTLSLSGCLDTFSGGGELTGGGDGSDDQRREIVSTYDDALIARNDAGAARDEGITAFNNRVHTDAIESLETALSGYEDAEAGFTEAANLAVEIDEDAAAAICETAVEEATLQIEATEAALSAARAANEGADAETINGHIETFRARRDEAAALSVEDTSAVANALGLE